MNGKDLTQGSIMDNIMTFSLPYMLAYFLQILYGLADLFVIGQYCGVESTTAVSNGAQVMYMVTVVLIGLAMGTTVLTARAIGAKDSARARTVVGNTVTMFAVVAIVLMVVLLCLRGWIVDVMDTPTEAVSGMEHYLTICFIGIPFVIAYNIIASIYRGLGDSKSPMYFVAVACVVNIILDYAFIGALRLGAMGAALGTTLSQAASVLFALYSIRRHKGVVDICRNDLRPQHDVIKQILKIGLPIAMQDGFIQISFLAITVIANGRGIVDAAAVGIVEKFIGLVFIVPSAMLSTVSAISAQNIGADKMPRAKQTMRTAMLITSIYGLVVAVTLQFIPQVAVGLFTSDSQVLAQGSDYLRGYVWDCIFAGIHFCFSGFFTACGYALISFLHNSMSIVCARVPLAWLSSMLYPDTLYPMGLSTCTGSFISCLICIGAYWWLKRRGKI
ncbi:MAG TPA: MATE family efflux transporter [Prevotella sp.]|nr:MATE family efflux transporter [Prevotella sp.]